MDKSILGKKYLVSPFSILDTIQGSWQDEKRRWIRLGIKSEEGRDKNLLNYSSLCKIMKGGIEVGSSIFDPYLCEILYTWFNTTDGTVLDPFAGGSVRGIVAEKLGHKYTGIELREEQVESNKKQAVDIEVSPTWLVGDSNKRLDDLPNNNYDMVLTCPPYYNLEVYSDDKDDLSTFPTYESFLEVYGNIIKKTVDKVKDNRFIIYVVTNFRDKNGNVTNFVGDTIRLHKECGVPLYNDMILANAIGTLPIRTSRSFPVSRKIGKRHQNILVFFKGDATKIRDIYPVLDTYGEKQKSLF